VAYYARKRSGTIASSGRRRPRSYAIAATLMGVETEYAVIGMSSRGERIDPDALTARLIDQAVASPARSQPGRSAAAARRRSADDPTAAE